MFVISRIPGVFLNVAITSFTAFSASNKLLRIWRILFMSLYDAIMHYAFFFSFFFWLGFAAHLGWQFAGWLLSKLRHKPEKNKPD